MRLLTIEDDELIAKNIKSYLVKKGFSVDLAFDLEEGYEKALNEEYDLIILDRMLPSGDGATLIQKLRNDEVDTPVLILTAKGENSDVIQGFNFGADDYLSKPFDFGVLEARIKALLRRGAKSPLEPVLKISGGIAIDINKACVVKDSKTINLSPREYALLEYLAVNKDKVVDRMTLLSHAWGEEVDPFSNTVDVHIKYIRNKLGNNIIKTVRGKGYMIESK